MYVQISASFLSMKNLSLDTIKKLENTDITYFHFDIMDGNFVANKTWHADDLKPIFQNVEKPIDIHFMVEDVVSYVDEFSCFHPAYMTFHYEAVKDVYLMIDYIHSYGIKVGIAINPNTPLEVLEPFYDLIDLVLIMSVEPGLGGQSFLPKVVSKIHTLVERKRKSNYSFKIEVDGGINTETYELVNDADILVVGSFITKNENYKAQVDKLTELEKN